MDKAQLRQRVRDARSKLSPRERESMASIASDHLFALPEFADATRVLLFASHGDELPTDRLIDAVVARGIDVLLPRVDGDTLEVVAAESVRELVSGHRGVREPTGPAVSTDGLDVAVVPGLAFDRAGVRLGQGGGHYDRLLAALPAATLRVGLCFDTQVVDEVPTEPHDEPVDVVVTERGTIRTHAR